MKRSIMCVVSMIVTVCILIGANVFTANAQSNFYSQATTLILKNHIENDAKAKYATAQGACTDSKYAYIAINSGSTTILKYDINTFKLVKKKSGLNLNHANDMTYNKDTNTIVVCNNSPNFDVISFVDPDTLNIISTKKIKHKIYSIAYNPDYNRYVVGLSGSYDYAVLDSNFKLIKKYKGYKSGYLRQGCDCDNNYIYFAQSGSSGNLIVIYDWNGNLIDTVVLKKSLEIENIFHSGNTFFCTLHYYGNYVYRIGINSKSAIKFNVKFNPNGGKGKMSSISVTYGKEKKMPKCKFTKEGYTFGGWIMKRNGANQYLGRKTPYSKPQWLSKKDIYEYVLYKDEQKISKVARVGDVTATAFWISDEYNIHYDANGGDGMIPSANVKYDENYLLSENHLNRDGYIFTGWYAKREFDNKIYGYKKGQSSPKWLLEKDVHRKHLFSDRQFVSKLTYDKDVTMYANWQIAFDFSNSGDTLKKYIGYDKNVTIPNQNDKLTTIADHAFYNSIYMESVTIPSSVTTISEHAFKHCNNLRTIYFENTMPQNVDATAFGSITPKLCVLKKDNKEYLLGTYYGEMTYKFMLHTYDKFFQ